MLLAAAQFIMVLDSSVMNVAITQIVADLDTTIEGVQLAITAYTLVMASGMLVYAHHRAQSEPAGPAAALVARRGSWAPQWCCHRSPR